MGRRTLHWHIGPDDLGTTFLAEALEAAADPLAEHGFAVAGPADLARAAGHDLRGPAWAALERRIWKHKGPTVLSTPGLAPAGRKQVRLALDGLRGVEVHPVLLVRGLPERVHAGWQSVLAQGRTTSPERYAERMLDPDRSHEQAQAFWAGNDLTPLLDRWTRTLHPERVHVVAVADDPDEIWSAFLGLAGLPSDAVRRPRTPWAWTAPGATRLDPGRVHELAAGWAKRVAEGGFDAHGSLLETDRGPLPVTTPAEQVESAAEALAAAGGEIVRLRHEVAAVRQENVRLDRKRRKHKRRLRELAQEHAPEQAPEQAPAQRT